MAFISYEQYSKDKARWEQEEADKVEQERLKVEQEEKAKQKELMTGQSKVVSQSKPDVYTPKKSTSTPTSANSNIEIKTVEPKTVTPQIPQSTVNDAIYVAKNTNPQSILPSSTKTAINNTIENANSVDLISAIEEEDNKTSLADIAKTIGLSTPLAPFIAGLGVANKISTWALNKEPVKKAINKIADITSNIPLKVTSAIDTVNQRIIPGYSGIGNPEPTKKSFKENYEDTKKEIEQISQQGGATGNVMKLLYGIQDSVGRNAVAVMLNEAGLSSLAMAMYAAVSANEQLDKKGKIDSIGNILIDTAGDIVIGAISGSLIKGGDGSKILSVLKSGNEEGLTEVIQEGLKLANNYMNAKTDSERNDIKNEAISYFKDGGIFMDYLVGALSSFVFGAAGKMTGSGTTSGDIINNVNDFKKSIELDNPTIEEEALTQEETPIQKEQETPTQVMEEAPVQEETPKPVVEETPKQNIEETITEITEDNKKDIIDQVLSRDYPSKVEDPKLTKDLKLVADIVDSYNTGVIDSVESLIPKYQDIAKKYNITNEFLESITNDLNKTKEDRKLGIKYAYENDVLSEDVQEDRNEIYADMLQNENKKQTKNSSNDITNNYETRSFVTNEDIDTKPIKVNINGVETQLNSIQTPEILEIAEDFMGKTPQLKDLRPGLGGYFRSGKEVIALSRDLMNNGQKIEAAAVFAHELGHAIDLMPTNIEDYQSERGKSLFEKLAKVQKGVSAEIKGAIELNKKITEEAIKLSEWWTPYNKKRATKSFINYRNSTPELYAQFMSALFIAPAEVQKRAPELFNLTMDYLQENPALWNNWLEIQSTINNDNLVASRRERAREQFKEGSVHASTSEVMRQEAIKKKNKPSYVFMKNFVDKTYPVEYLVNKLKKKGQTLSDSDNPLPVLREMAYFKSPIKAYFVEEVMPILEEYTNLGFKDYTILGEMLEYRRIAYGDRGNITNPVGLDQEMAMELLGENLEDGGNEETFKEIKSNDKSLRNELGEEKYKKVNEIAEKLSLKYFELMKKGAREGLFSEELIEELEPNAKYYAPFRPIKYQEQKFSGRIYKSKGSFNHIESPFDAMIQQMLNLNKKIIDNNAKVSLIDFMNNFYKGEEDLIKEAKRNDKGAFGSGVTRYYKNGKEYGVYLDKDLANIFTNNSMTSNVMPTAVKILEKTAKSLMTSMFVPFQIRNTIRDVGTTLRQNHISPLKFAKSYIKSIPTAFKKGFDIEDSKVLKMYKDSLFSSAFYDMFAEEGKYNEETINLYQVDKISKYLGIENPITKNMTKTEKIKTYGKELRFVTDIFDFMSSIGESFEALPKMAMYNILSENGTKQLNKQQIDNIRRYTGSPDFLAHGNYMPVINMFTMFANPMIQGNRVGIENMIGHHGNWKKDEALKEAMRNTLKAITMAGIPAILMFMGEKGVFGKKISKAYQKTSSYMKKNYFVVPVMDGLSLKMPVDQFDQIMLQQMYGLLHSKDYEDVLESLLKPLLDQSPSQNPILNVVTSSLKFISGQNIYDSFRDKYVFSEDEMLLGLGGRAKSFLKYFMGAIGGNIFINNREIKDDEVFAKAQRVPVLGPIISGMFITNDAGEKEMYNVAANIVKVNQARTKQHINDFVEEYIDEFKQGNKTVQERNKIIKKAQKDYKEKYKDTLSKADLKSNLTKVENKIKSSINKSLNNTVAVVLSSTSTNAEKIAILQKNREFLEDDEQFFKDLKEFYKMGIISDTVYNSFKKSKK